MRKLLSLLLKAAVSGVLLYVALNWVDIGAVAGRFNRIVPGWLVLGVLASLAQMALTAIRWQQILAQCGGRFGFGYLFRVCMIGAFFNQTLPSSVGGDAMRIWLVGKRADWRLATYSVLLDRLVGVIALAVLVIACLPWTLRLVTDPVGRAALLVIGGGSLAAGAMFLALGWRRLRFLHRWAPTRHLAATAAVAMDILRAPRRLSAIMAVSFVSHFTTVVSCWCAARAVGADLSLLNALYLVLPVALISIVPISIAGWGVREGAMVAAFAYAGLPQSDGLVVSILFGGMALVLGAAGGLVWVFDQIETPTLQRARHEDVNVSAPDIARPERSAGRSNPEVRL
jgi:uncharacterized membrane protein YbhN (UPF0104 family)